MKRIISFLGAVILISTTSVGVVSCAGKSTLTPLTQLKNQLQNAFQKVNYEIDSTNTYTFTNIENNETWMYQKFITKDFNQDMSLYFYFPLSIEQSGNNSQIKEIQSTLFSSADQTLFEVEQNLVNINNNESKNFYYSLMAIDGENELGFLLNKFVSEIQTGEDSVYQWNSSFEKITGEGSLSVNPNPAIELLAKTIMFKILKLDSNSANWTINFGLYDQYLQSLETYLIRNLTIKYDTCQYKDNTLTLSIMLNQVESKIKIMK